MRTIRPLGQAPVPVADSLRTLPPKVWEEARAPVVKTAPSVFDPSEIWAAISDLRTRVAALEARLSEALVELERLRTPPEEDPGKESNNEKDDAMFQLIKDVDGQRVAQESMAQTIEAMQAQAAELSGLLRQVHEAIAAAPISATYAVTLSKDRTAQVSGRDALEFVCAVMVAADAREARMKLADGSTMTVDVGDLEQVCRQIAAQMAAGK